MQNLDDYDIVKTYGAEYRGIVQYYLLANDVWRLNRLCWDAQTSMLKTLAAKHQSSVAKMAAKHRAKIETPYGPRTCYRGQGRTRTASSRWSHGSAGYPWCGTRRRSSPTASRDQVTLPAKGAGQPAPDAKVRAMRGTGQGAVHQVRNLASLGKPGPGQPPWAALMAKKRRKTLVVCHPCHDAIHHGQPTAQAA